MDGKRIDCRLGDELERTGPGGGWIFLVSTALPPTDLGKGRIATDGVGPADGGERALVPGVGCSGMDVPNAWDGLMCVNGLADVLVLR